MPPPPPLAYRLVRLFVGGLLRLFFRDIAVEGERHVPRDRGGLGIETTAMTKARPENRGS